MRQVLIRLPIPTPWSSNIPIYGFGFMLVVALFVCTWLAGRRARKEGIAKEHVYDVAFYLVLAGIVGARLVFMIQYGQPLESFYKFWEGGLVWYGALAGGAVGYLLAYYFVLRKHGISTWKLADIIAPSLALGLAFGRVGCLLNGCCYGGVACTGCPALHFPVHSFAGGLHSPEQKGLVTEGYQALAGFTVTPESLGARAPSVVAAVDASSAAARAGLQPGDVIVKADGTEMHSYAELEHYLRFDPHWQQGKTDLQLTVRRGGTTVNLPAFRPRTLGLYPTQVYESISMVLLFLLLTAYFPFRRHDGEVMLLFLTLYPLHRFLNEMLRNDTDPVAFGLTLSQNGSLLILAVALALWAWVLSRPAQYHPFAEKKELTPAGV
jgi:phosphatidylglycerol---prolipoprotein diacylglyceryl transferase